MIAKMHAPLCICNCGQDIDFPIEKDGTNIALVAHKWGGFVRELYTNADDYQINCLFSFSLDRKKKQEKITQKKQTRSKQKERKKERKKIKGSK